jgi:hypothetical protein
MAWCRIQKSCINRGKAQYFPPPTLWLTLFFTGLGFACPPGKVSTPLSTVAVDAQLLYVEPSHILSAITCKLLYAEPSDLVIRPSEAVTPFFTGLGFACPPGKVLFVIITSFTKNLSIAADAQPMYVELSHLVCILGGYG